MTHVMTHKPYTCAKCKKEDIGSAMFILDHVVCPGCYHDKYEVELVPIIKQMINEYFLS